MLSLNIVTPNDNMRSMECQSIRVNTLQGEIQVLPGHASLLAQLENGILECHLTDGNKEKIANEKGVIKVLNDQVVIICDGTKE